MAFLNNGFQLDIKLKQCLDIYELKNKKTPVDKNNLSMVLYTDGGCTEPTVSAWGVHGYIYGSHETNSNSSCKSAVPTNKGYKSSAGGDAHKVPVVAYLNYSGYDINPATNNTAEIQAMLEAFELIRLLDVKNVLILADSMYVLTLLINYEKYISNGFKSSTGKQLANVDKVKELISYYTELAGYIKIELKHVKGHSGDFGNDKADALCTEAMNICRNAKNNVEVNSSIPNVTNRISNEFFRMEDPESFFGIMHEPPKLLTEQCLFFTTNGIATPHRSRYYIGSFGEKLKSKKTDEKKLFRGKPFADACISVVELNKPDAVTNDLIEIFNSVSPVMGDTGVVELNLAYQNRSSIYNDLAKGDTHSLLVDSKSKRLVAANKTNMASLIYPPRLAYRLMRDFEIISEMLDDYRANLPSSEIIKARNVTDLFYEISESKGKKTYKVIPNEVGVVHVPITFNVGDWEKTTIVKLTIGVDLPNNISLGRLKSTEPEITLFIFDVGPRILRYGTYIKTVDGDGIWMGIYSNIHLH